MATTVGASKPGNIQKPKKEEKKQFFSDKRKKDDKAPVEESAED